MMSPKIQYVIHLFLNNILYNNIYNNEILMNKSIVKAVIITAVIAALISGLMVLEMNELAPAFKQTGQLVFYVAITFISIFIGVLIAAIMFHRNRKNPRMMVKRAKIVYAGYAAAIAGILFILPNFLMKKSAASCIKPNIYAVISDPLNIKVCMNIKSVLVAKFLPFTTPLFLGNLIVSVIVIMIITLLIYFLVTAKFLYSNNR